MATCTVSGTLKDLTETAIESATIKANIKSPVESSTTLILDKEVSTTSASDGTWSLALFRTAVCTVTIEFSDGASGKIRRVYTITVPETASANFTDLVS